MKHQFTNEQQNYIAKNYLLKSSTDLGLHCKCTGQVVRRYLKEQGLIVPAEVSNGFRTAKKVGKTSFTAKEDRYIKQHYLRMPLKRIAAKLNRSGCGVKGRLNQLGLVIPKEVSELHKIDSRIKPGNTPPNAGCKQTEYMSAEAIARTAGTRFKKGNRPHNTKQADGEVTIRRDSKGNPYKYIRVSLGKWDLLHRHNWIKVNGLVPPKHCLWCINGDTLNCDPTNWDLITRAENALRNSGTVTLTAKRVASYLATTSRKSDIALRDEILNNHPELVTAKRTQLLINRKLKEHGTEQNRRS